MAVWIIGIFYLRGERERKRGTDLKKGKCINSEGLNSSLGLFKTTGQDARG